MLPHHTLIVALRKENNFMKDKIKGTKKFPANESADTKLPTFLAILACITLPLIIYSDSLHAPFIFDDIPKIVENPDIKNISQLKTKLIYPYLKEFNSFNRNDPSRPLTYLTYALNYRLSNLNTFGYHIVNVVLHGLTVIMIFLLVRRMLFLGGKTNSALIPSIVALLFAVHPVNSSAVSYIFARSDIIATFFYLFSILSFSYTVENRRWIYYLSLLGFVLAILSKQIAVALPAAVLIFDYFFMSDCQFKKTFERRYYHLWFWSLLLIYLIWRYYYLGGIGDLEATSTADTYSYLITQPYIILKYLSLLIVPTGLSIDHLITMSNSVFETRVFLSIIALIGILFMSLWLLRREKTVLSKVILFSILWFFITLSPTSSFFPTTAAMADNRLYLPGFGFCLVLVLAYQYIFKFEWGDNFKSKKGAVFVTILSAHIIVLSILTWDRNKIYVNPVLAWEDVVSNYPNRKSTSRAYINLGNLYREKKNYQLAFSNYSKALELNPVFPDGLVSLGILYSEQKNYNKAYGYYLKALELNPNSGEAHHNLGLLYKKLGQYKKAYQELTDAIRLSPSPTDVYNDLGTLFYELRRYEEARQNYEMALNLNPEHVSALNNLGILAFEKGEYQEACQIYKRVIILNPKYVSAYLNLGNLYYVQKDFENAESSYRKAIELNSDLAGKIALAKKILSGSTRVNVNKENNTSHH